MMDDFIEGYVAHGLTEEAFCIQADVESPNGRSELYVDLSAQDCIETV